MTTELHSGTVQLPAALLQKHGMSGDGEVELVDTERGILILPHASGNNEASKYKSVRDLAGFLEGSSAVETLLRDRAEEAKKENDRLRS